jgi:hypothetical protein
MILYIQWSLPSVNVLLMKSGLQLSQVSVCIVFSNQPGLPSNNHFHLQAEVIEIKYTGNRFPYPYTYYKKIFSLYGEL